jgi:hypothetical protein
MSVDAIRSSRIEAALARALDHADHAELFDLLARTSGLPGPRANLSLATSVGTAIAAAGRRGVPLAEALLGADHEFLNIVGAIILGERVAANVDAKRSMAQLHDMAEDPRFAVREGVVAALRIVLARRGEAAVVDLAAWTDGYLHAHVVLEALSDRELLASMRSGAEVLARLDEAFALADVSPRAAERLQGVRTLRRSMPAQIATIAARFPEAIAWLTERTRTERPESREVIEETIRALRKRSLALSDTDRLTAALTASAPPPRDPSRIVHGTRRRSKGRR